MAYFPVGPVSQLMVCPMCHKQISTKIEYQVTKKTNEFALILCLFLCIPCALVAYCMKSCKDRKHFCPHCNTHIGTYRI